MNLRCVNSVSHKKMVLSFIHYTCTRTHIYTAQITTTAVDDAVLMRMRGVLCVCQKPIESQV